MDEELRRLVHLCSKDPTLENLAALGAAYLRSGVREKTLLIFREDARHKYLIEIQGRRWRQKSTGNTYHSVQVFLNGELLAETRMQYGYDDAYMQTAMELIREHTDLDPTYPLTIWTRENNIDLRYSVIDVSRQRDL